MSLVTRPLVRFSLSFACLAALCCGLATSPARAERVGHGKFDAPVGNTVSQVNGLSVSYASLADAINCLVGPGVAATNAVYNGSALSLGTFTGGAAIIGFDSGLILSSGDVTFVVGPNQFDNVSASTGSAGDADLTAIAGQPTFDAASIEFDFDCSEATEFSLEYVFASDEYNEFVNTPFNDVFAFFLDGAGNNIAVVPAFCSSPGQPITINSVNCGNPFPGVGVNCGCYRNNDLSDGGGAINTEMDGLTAVLARTVPIAPGSHHLKIAIADASDRIYDSNVFLRCQSLVCAASTKAKKSTWGELKTLYR